jgi:voltage-gated potassium channel
MRKIKRIELHIIIAILIVTILLFAGAIFYHEYENMSWVDAFYLTVATVMTIGYGDLHPTSEIAKIFTTIYAVISVPTFVFCFGIIVEDYFEERVHKIEDAVNDAIVKEQDILKEKFKKK